jgi:hypothetical protein
MSGLALIAMTAKFWGRLAGVLGTLAIALISCCFPL